MAIPLLPLVTTNLHIELDKIPLWRGNQVGIKQLVEDFTKYLYMPRLKDTLVLLATVPSGIGLLWRQESFLYADKYDNAAKRSRGLRSGSTIILINRYD
jgi:hypothetical protein